MTAQQFWEILHRWLGERASDMCSLINPPATEDEIAALESVIGYPLPAEFRASYLIHNGCDSNSGLIAGLGMMAIDQILSNWEMWSEIAADDDEDLNEPCESVPAKAIRLKYAHSGWLPFCGDSQNFVAVDFAPDSCGKNAQIINTGRDDEIRHVIAEHISGFFDFVAQQFRDGRVSVRQSRSNEIPRWLAVDDSGDLLTKLPDLLVGN